MKSWILAAIALLCMPAMTVAAEAPGAVLPEGTAVVISLREQVDSRMFKQGDYVPIIVAEDVRLGDRVVIPAGTPGRGQVINADDPGELAEPGEIEVAARWLNFEGRTVLLKGLRLNKRGKEIVQHTPGYRIFVGYMAVLKPGTMGEAALAEDLPVSGAVGGAARMRTPPVPPLGLTPPTAGKAQVVFLRQDEAIAGSASIGIWTTGAAPAELGTLPRGGYFTAEVEPGVHQFTSNGPQPDTIVVEAEAGETYYVLGRLLLRNSKLAGTLAPVYADFFRSVAPKPNKPRRK